ncbi:CapA family protein [Coraliomargarita sp. SDUM461004]|uniref:CapA family protein n=1 Tax=Thalassobacterium sedimentorum TaxID=3041258 RepID=A0ABU1ADM3_9BACT|nr:CapA family protein [Coraliomargarita sp. SDUM461004]MDQ8192800.1 CapA family protein [Coraliomargarita sp. SDUM461004]
MIESTSMKINFAGDICLQNYRPDDFRLSSSWMGVQQLLNDADYTIANFEGTITEPNWDCVHKIGLPVRRESLEALAVDNFIFNVGNNHFGDFGEKGAKLTIDTFKELGVRWFGYGDRLLDARKPLVLEHENCRIACLSYVDVTTNSDFLARYDSLGVPPLAFPDVLHDIEAIQKNVDYIVVNLHWGIENVFYPTYDQIHMAHAIIDAGVDVIIGHHQHVYQGMEEYGDGVIFYGLGNFIMPDLQYKYQYQDGPILEKKLKQLQENKEAIIAQIDFSPEGFKYKIIPVKQTGNAIPQIANFDEWSIPYAEINEKLLSFIKKKRRQINAVRLHQYRLIYNGRIFQNIYSYPTIDKLSFRALWDSLRKSLI